MDAQKKSYKLDHDLIFKLASMHCTYEEIADCVGTSVTTLQKRFKNLIEKGKAEGKTEGALLGSGITLVCIAAA